VPSTPNNDEHMREKIKKKNNNKHERKNETYMKRKQLSITGKFRGDEPVHC
jgi:hypothetical protein